MRFSIRQLNYFIAAGEESSIRKASEKIKVSQPSISTAISQLENEFDLQLFVRHHAQGLSLTSVGQVFLREAKQFVAHGHEIEQTIGDFGASIAGDFNVACLSSIAPFVIPEICHRFESRYEKVRLNSVEANQAEIFAQLLSGEIDIAVTYDLDQRSDIEFTPLLSLPPYALLSSGHPLASKTTVSLEELAKEPFVLLDLPHSREYFLSLFRQSGLVPLISKRTGQSEVARGLVAAGHGYSLANIQPSNRYALNGGELSYLKLTNSCPALQLGVSVLKSSRRSRVLEAFIEHCRSITHAGIPGTIAGSLTDV